MNKKRVYIVWLFALAVAMVLMIALFSSASASPAHIDPTYVINGTQTPLTMYTPTALVSVTPRSNYPCTAVPATNVWGLPTNVFPTVNMPTSELGATATNEPVLPTATLVNINNFHGSPEWDLFSTSAHDGRLSCVNQAGSRHDYDYGDNTVMTFDTIECLGNFTFTGNYWNGYGNPPMMKVGFNYQAYNATGDTMYYNFDTQGTSCGQGFTASPSLGYGSTSDLSIHRFTGQCKTNSLQSASIYFYLKASRHHDVVYGEATKTATPIPTAVPNTPSIPVASFPDHLVFTSGGCNEILPSTDFSFGGLFGMPDVHVPALSVCVMFVTLSATFLSLSLDSVLIPFIVLGFGFAIYNEFRS
jgi:hypothetical protein